ncbi:hypothetical protein J7T55_013790 [Diaporthe amygdali]|uniref:uncharacterized protein n=1 Tax=Phomopsis amygdali TaxID=1214568 RepID=UPI0022FE4A36|nr:uncharacterized protein J7T55_013790 [Diaporthe amygdali]KAJ0119587.1 hypothetical protein J7T55_013790 [Diaporthe amygdali]
MDMRHEQGYPPQNGWQPEGSTHESYSEKQDPHSQKANKSKRFIWRMFRLGATLALAITVLVLTLIILLAGRHGDGSSDLSLVTINMTDFARFNPPVITLVDNNTEATKTKRGIGSFFSDAADKAGDAADSIETFASGAASAVESAAGAVATAASEEADKIIGEIGDKLEDIENAVVGLMEKVLSSIQDALNKWLQEAASALDDIDIPRTMSLHLTTYCSGNATSSSSNSTSDSNSTTTSTSCTRLFSTADTSFNSTANNGTIFGFQPGAVLAKALGVFFVPEGAQTAIREPVDSAVNTVDRLVHQAGEELSTWTVNLLFIPIVVMYALAAFFTCLLLLILLAATALSFRSDEGLPPKVYSLCGTIAAAAAFFLLLGSVILTVIAMVAYVVGLAVGVVDITVSSSSQLKWMSWAAFAIMAFVAISLKVEEFVAECVFWWNFLGKLFGKKGKGGTKDMFREHSGHH